MSNNSSQFPTHSTRLGFHYFPDSFHFRESDLVTWLPELLSFGASWLVLTAPSARAIPEPFIRGLVKSGVEPLIDFKLSLSAPATLDEIRPVLEAYAHWGVHGVNFFSRPNSRLSWTTTLWAQQDLIERFLDRFVPLANLALEMDMAPIFSPLEPGGNYWDTAFLRSALESLERRNQKKILDKLILGAYSWTGGRSLDWGAGGPERWPSARPYFTPPNTPDQRGFRIFDWYEAITESVLGETRPIILFQADANSDPERSASSFTGSQTSLAVAQLLAGEKVYDPSQPGELLEPLPAAVQCANLWLLACGSESAYQAQAWYRPDGSRSPAIEALQNWVSHPRPVSSVYHSNSRQESADFIHPIHHYLLLPSYDWGIADYHLEVIRPYVKKFRPTIGYSIEEAALASHVTVIGGPQNFTDDSLEQLRQAGCWVERINGDGTTIATILAER